MATDETKQCEFQPVTARRWNDLVKLFGDRGASGGCWCMWWRLNRSEFEHMTNDERREALHRIVRSNHVPGILAYADGEPVGWCSVAPRESYAALERSRTLKPVDDQPVWSIVCFFISRAERRQGLTVELLRAAAQYAAGQGAMIVEGYPTDPGGKQRSASDLYMGTVSAFRRAGFRKVRRDPRPVMRYVVGQGGR